MTKVVCRATNRTIVGLPLCRNPDYLELTTQFAADVVTMSSILRLVPPFLRPIINHLFTKLPQRLQRGMKHLKPIIDSRREEQEKIGNGYEKPLDFLSWLMEAAQGEEQTIENLTRRILVVNFAAIHTSSMVNPNLYIPYTELIEGIPVICTCPLLFSRPTRIHWVSSRRS